MTRIPAIIIVSALLLSTTPVRAAPTPLNLHLGVFEPLTGALSSLGPDMRDGALMAVDDVNALTGTTGLTITPEVKDDGTTDTSGDPSKLQGFANDGATAVVGPCCSGVTASVLNDAIQDHVLVVSPSATSPALTLGRDNQGFFWRISPSDAVQAKVLARIVRNDGWTSAAAIYVNNAYGSYLNSVFRQEFGNSNVLSAQPYNEQNTGDFSSQVANVCSQAAQALMIFGLDSKLGS